MTLIFMLIIKPCKLGVKIYLVKRQPMKELFVMSNYIICPKPLLRFSIIMVQVIRYCNLVIWQIRLQTFKKIRGVKMELYRNRIVIKVGTSTLTNENGLSNLRAFDGIARLLSDLQNRGYEMVLVSSGAIASGAGKLKIKRVSSSMSLKQAAAAVGQCRIMSLYDKFFSDYDKTAAQILLNAEDIAQSEKKKNLIEKRCSKIMN